jgi:hypothetical protein
MDKQSIFFSCITAIVSTALMLITIQYLAKRQNILFEKEQKINISYSIWLTSLMVAFFILLKVSVELIENSIELIINSKSTENAFVEVMQKISIFIGFTFIFTFLSYYIVHSLLKLVIGNRIDSIEIQKDNYGYFIVKGLVLILFVISLITIFEHFLNWFMPTVETPFYH